MTPKRKKFETLTEKIKSLKRLRRDWEERENRIKNVSEKISKKYRRRYDENSQLKKINLDFLVSEKRPTDPTMNPIKELSGLYICPRIYATFKEVSENSNPKMRDMGVTPEILLESIISPFFESQDIDINKIIIRKKRNELHYNLIDESGRKVIYIKLHTKSKVEYTKSKTGTLLKYLKNKKAFDELIFKEYIEQFKKGFYVLKTEISTKKSDHSPILEESNNVGKELRIALCKTPGFYGVELEYGPENSGYSILYSLPKDAGLSKITNTIMKAIPEIQSYCKLTGRNPSEIPINNKGFTNYDYFERKLKKLLKESPNNYRNENKD